MVISEQTRVPRWTLEPRVGVAVRRVEVDADLEDALRGLSKQAGVPLSTLLLTAHAVTMAALTRESDVVIGYTVPGWRAPLPCRISTGPRTWRELVDHVREAELAVLDHACDQEPQPNAAPFESALDVSGTDGQLEEGLAVRVSPSRYASRLTACYRTELLDAAAAGRFLGYHLQALTLMSDDPDTEHRGRSLLSQEERRLQVFGMAGRARKLPARRPHQLFEDQARRRPDLVAAAHGEERLTYGELNARANRVARGLLAAGVRRETVVAVMMERNLDWMVSVLAVLKAGGVYLPLEPHFPPDRIERVLERAGCRLALSEPRSSAALDRAVARLGGARRLFVGEVLQEPLSGENVDIDVAADQLAYIYFTSGSTGEPKGAMCEHAGMLNHLLAKIDDLGVEEGGVVAQTAPQCFDISLWQLMSALLVGGRTLIVEQEAVLDVERFLDRVVDGHVSVLQVVPSYLDAVLSYLEQRPRALPDLRCVSVTGEAVKKELVQRWFAVNPDIPLVNAYGLTETSDDTNHEVMTVAPDHASVPVGRPISNVHVYVVDEALEPVPLGAVGEIVFSGVCVGRGYVNDPERTQAAFMFDPHRRGARLYRSGDFGRWLPDGKLEFLGRRDAQVKVSGFRIEIGEVENALLKADGVRDGAVVVVERAERGPFLVGFCSGPRPVDVEAVRAALGRTLPPYMVPTVLLWQPTLPLTPNGKIDRKALTALAAETSGPEERRRAPATAAERRLAAAWADVLGVPVKEVGVLDNFFDRGGTSLTAVRLVVALDRAVSLKDVIRHPVLADLAQLLDAQTGHSRSRTPVTSS
jgi:amino acid adenylation domain-containing protein